ncbi:MAG: DUF11 domain-containing protein, partial [Clostridium sp.]|uniref:DUF11 domain-containing protein n=1 Tax=Clostridium sp. TaxID=1506 RepID=UPI003F3CF8FD
YTIVLNNSGILNATTATFIDTLPTDITLIPNTLKVDGVLNNQTSNPLNIDLSPFNSMEVKTITFDVQIVNTIPSINPIINKSFVNYNYIDDSGVAITMDTISNGVVTTVAYGSLVANKIVDKSYAEVLDVLTYTIPIHYNVGNMSLYNIKFIDTLPSEVTLNSIMVDGVTVVGGLSSPGITIPTIPVGGVSTVSFKVTVNTVSTINPIVNSSYIKYSYTQDPGQPSINSDLNTNIVQTTIINSKFDIKKIVDKSFATNGDTLTYTIVIKNIGNTIGKNLNFVDTIANSLAYISGTLKLNGALIGGTPSNISIGNVLSGETVTIIYQTKIN